MSAAGPQPSVRTRIGRAIRSSRPPRRAVPHSMPPYATDESAGRTMRISIAIAVFACLAVLAGRAYGDPVEAIVRAKLAPSLPAGLDVARVYLPAQLAALDVDPARVAVEPQRELRAGRSSVKLTVRGKTTWVPVAIAALAEIAIAQRQLAPGDVIAEGDVAIERRATADFVPASTATLIGASVTTAIAAGAPIGARDVALPPPLPRGTQIAIDVRRGAVHVRGTGILELAARPGELATARFGATRMVVRGRLVAPATLIVGEP